MTNLVPPPPINPPPFDLDTKTVGLVPQVPFNQEQFRPTSHSDFPPFKKPRNSDHFTSNSFENPPSNSQNYRPMSRMFFKTRLCSKFKLGTCPYGDNCNFAHGVEEIRKPPPNWQDIVAAQGGDWGINSWGDQQSIINKFRVCKKFYNGEECPYGDRCNFLHGNPGMFRENSEISAGATMVSDNGNAPDNSDGNGFAGSGDKPVFWKTRMCHKWETTGNCPFGEKCHFAHGLAELKKFIGSHMEAEKVHSELPLSKPLPNTTNDISPSKTAAAATCKQQQPQVNNFFAKLKGSRKINRIYADWIDDLPLPRCSPSKADS